MFSKHRVPCEAIFYLLDRLIDVQIGILFLNVIDLSVVKEVIVVVFTAAEIQTKDFWKSVDVALKKHQESPLPRYFVLTKVDETENQSDEVEALARQKCQDYNGKFFRVRPVKT
jgi:hypothetical protein